MEQLKINSIDNIELDVIIHKKGSNPHLGCVILAHGITTDMDGEGKFIRLDNRLASVGFDVVRFSYRGHGKSGGTQRGMTISGEMLDLQAVFEFASEMFGQPLAIVAASFGAVSTCLSLPYIDKRLKGLALWNPVLNLKRTFVNPELTWGKQNFDNERINQFMTKGYLLLDDSFEFGRVLYEEMKHYDPYSYFVNSSTPSLIIHGDRDTYVPYSVSIDASKNHRNCRLFTIEGSDHGFDSRDKEDMAINITVDWLKKHIINNMI